MARVGWKRKRGGTWRRQKKQEGARLRARRVGKIFFGFYALACGCILSWGAVLCSSVVPLVLRCAAVCVVSCWWCSVVWLALAGAVCCRLWLAGVCSWVRWAAVVFRWSAFLRVLLAGHVACCPAVCRGWLWCPAALYCVLCSVVLCCRVVPCCGALLPVFLCWWCPFFGAWGLPPGEHNT